MGRKPAPEPLPLGSTSTSTAAPETPRLELASAPGVVSAPVSASNNNRTGETGRQPKFVYSTPNSPNTPQSSLTPTTTTTTTATTTPVSPTRSPFARFGNPKKPSSSSQDQQQQQQQTQAQAQSQSQSPSLPSPNRPPHRTQPHARHTSGGDGFSTSSQQPPLALHVADAAHHLKSAETRTAEAENDKSNWSDWTSTPTKGKQPAESRAPYVNRTLPHDTAHFSSIGATLQKKPVEKATGAGSTALPSSSTSSVYRVSEDTPPQSLQHSQNQNHHQNQHQTQPVQPPNKNIKSGFFFFKGSSNKNSSGRASPDPASDMSRGSDTSSASAKHADSSSHHTEYPLHKQPHSASNSRTDITLQSTNEREATTTPQSSAKKLKPKPFNILGRNNKGSRDIDSPSSKDYESVRIVEPDNLDQEGGLRTAPPAREERSFRDMMSSAARNNSADRSIHREGGSSVNSHNNTNNNSNSNNNGANSINGNRDASTNQKDHSRHHPSGTRDATFLGNLIKNSSNKAADMFSKGIFKGGWSSGGGGGSGGGDKDCDVDDDHYQLKVMNLPLVEQTRKTRISKRLEESRDKTEFWMPSFPWRAIDYLNYKGADVEGLYRVPGSGQHVRKWQRRFDEELDIDLYAQTDLYDINIIGSMLKAWLRELPDELFPKEAQDRVARECIGSEKVPQMLVDELSNLPPFNYYLLFAITCHLSLLLAHSDKNKMDFRNLCICFQPCMRIDAFSFKFLVCDWRDCWQGCKNEGRYIEEEYRLFDLPPPRGLAEPRRPVTQPPSPHQQPQKSPIASPSFDDLNSPGTGTPRTAANASSQGSATPTPSVINNPPDAAGYKGRLKKKMAASESTDSVGSDNTISTTFTVNDREGQDAGRASGDMRPLSPIKPLSPLNF